MNRCFLEVSAGQGPAECRLLASRLARHLSALLPAAPVAANGDWPRDAARSILLALEGEGAAAAAAPYLGTVQWVAPSPFRPGCRRRNWFAGVRLFAAEPESCFRPEDIEVAVSFASGPGGQHVNRTKSKVQLLHRPTGIRVSAAEERSQHRNRALALARLAVRLAECGAAAGRALEFDLWRGHHALARGTRFSFCAATSYSV